MTSDKLLNHVLLHAIQKFYKMDGILLENNREGMERSCVFRIGVYLQQLIDCHIEFDGLNLDCEYNKSNEGRKLLDGEPVIPDLIIHKRNLNNPVTNDNNTMIIEFKGHWNHNEDNDYNKLRKFTLSSGEYGYQLGVFVRLNMNDYELKYFKNGQEVAENDL